ncbi:MAG TPA: hypothetical protein VK726_09990 [Acetobacteraceae bacterium]|jgi:adenosylhomocysteine nucleosidase|nr:hypothetical protein [Acetobacteraceae bacterium]
MTPNESSPPTVIVGLVAEARVAGVLNWPVSIGGGNYEGAVAAAERAVRAGARALISFGLAGGLDPVLHPGTLLLPTEVLTDDRRIPTDVSLRIRLGSGLPAPLLGVRTTVATAAAKHVLFTTTGAAALDLESGAVARIAQAHDLPFAVLRAICDPADRDLPAAALIALDHHGAIGFGRVIASIIAQPRQLPTLLRLARDADTARQSLHSAAKNIR